MLIYYHIKKFNGLLGGITFSYLRREILTCFTAICQTNPWYLLKFPLAPLFVQTAAFDSGGPCPSGTTGP